MLRVLQHLLGWPPLDDPPLVEHEDLVGDHPRAEQVVGDVEQAEAALAAQLGQQLEHPGPERDVEHGDGLVGDDQPRVAGERAGDEHPLALAAGQLVRQLGRELARRGRGPRSRAVRRPAAGPALADMPRKFWHGRITVYSTVCSGLSAP